MKIKNMKKLIASCLILSLLGSTASVCFGMVEGENTLNDDQSQQTQTNKDEILIETETTETTPTIEIKEEVDPMKKEESENEKNEIEEEINQTQQIVPQQPKPTQTTYKDEIIEEENAPGLSTGEKVLTGVGVTVAIATIATAVITPCVIFKDKISAWFKGPFVDFFTKTIPNAFTPKKKASK